MLQRFFTALIFTFMGAGFASADLLVTEIYPGVPGPDNTPEWFEIYNNGTTDMDISSLYFDDESADPTVNDFINIVGGATTLGAGEYLIVFNDVSDGDAAGEIANFESFWGVGGFTYGRIDNGAGLNDDGDAVFVFDGNTAGANVVASLDYSALSLSYQTAVLDLGTGQAVAATVGNLGAFSSAGTAGTDNLAVVGSPGAVNIPEPTSALIIAGGLLFAATRRRK